MDNGPDGKGKPLPEGCVVPRAEYIGNGFCGGGRFNNEACGWDGGDCCPETCVTAAYKCGKWSEYDCRDPRYRTGMANDLIVVVWRTATLATPLTPHTLSTALRGAEV